MILHQAKKVKKKKLTWLLKKKKNALIEFLRIFCWPLKTFFDIFVNNDKDIVNLERCVTLKKKTQVKSP